MEWRLRQIMQEMGLTQEKTAELLDCSKGQISMLLSGDRKFHSDWIERISTAFKIPSWYLFVDPKTVLDEFDRELASRFRDAPEDVQMNIKRQLGMLDMNYVQDLETKSVVMHEATQASKADFNIPEPKKMGRKRPVKKGSTL